MRNHVGGSLAPLASRKIQERYIVRGTRDEYALAGEVLNSAWYVVESIEENVGWAQYLSEDVRTAVDNFGRVLRKHESLLHDESWDNEGLINRDSRWDEIRRAAQECLSRIGFDLEEWEHSEGVVND